MSGLSVGTANENVQTVLEGTEDSRTTGATELKHWSSGETWKINLPWQMALGKSIYHYNKINQYSATYPNH